MGPYSGISPTLNWVASPERLDTSRKKNINFLRVTTCYHALATAICRQFLAPPATLGRKLSATGPPGDRSRAHCPFGRTSVRAVHETTHKK